MLLSPALSLAFAMLAPKHSHVAHIHLPPGIAVLCYHDLNSKATNDMVNTPKNFESHLIWLKSHGYQTLSVDELVDVMKERRAAPPKAVVITFDDGYEGVYRYAFPLLKKYGMQATLFLVTSKMGDQNMPMPHLTWPQIEEMDASGVIRSAVHADQLHVKLGLRLTHEMQTGLPVNDISNDLAAARREIESHVGRPVHTIAWPFGDYNNNLIRLACGLGYTVAFNTEYGLNRPGDSVLKIKRLRVSSKFDTEARLEKKLAHYGLR